MGSLSVNKISQLTLGKIRSLGAKMINHDISKKILVYNQNRSLGAKTINLSKNLGKTFEKV
ncbi:hypothetical protein BpHYR1_010990 [Brachionus plicatilis]|uniref:Uncharacterized protein n=1 Tax=Brachionus plicatilis TaxID=10195 RepID=A0A3M7T104_BRAPC|nr:hypothetical protein BpHYR1_010990 [Brachionus plicatilis]